MADELEELLRRLTVNDERSLRSVLAGGPGSPDGGGPDARGALDPRMRTLVRLAALLAADASTTSLRWAVESAWGAGADDEEIVGVLLTVAEAVGFARVVSAAPRLALAIGYDIEAVGWDGS
jgi:alkylhydroperoxidase/carboxymuconolactone decarboxylase family protein YurZ